MARTILIDELHLAFLVSNALTAAEYQAIRRSIRRPSLEVALSAAVRQVLHRCPSLSKIRVRLSR